MRYTSLPPGTTLYTPSGRKARAMYVDEEGRLHVRYVGPDCLLNEQGCYPIKLVRPADIIGSRDDA